jgi:hypothetical protein
MPYNVCLVSTPSGHSRPLQPEGKAPTNKIACVRGGKAYKEPERGGGGV